MHFQPYLPPHHSALDANTSECQSFATTTNQQSYPQVFSFFVRQYLVYFHVYPALLTSRVPWNLIFCMKSHSTPHSPTPPTKSKTIILKPNKGLSFFGLVGSRFIATCSEKLRNRIDHSEPTHKRANSNSTFA